MIGYNLNSKCPVPSNSCRRFRMRFREPKIFKMVNPKSQASTSNVIKPTV
jgi:hypothetical protein